MSDPLLNIQQIVDIYIRKNFEALTEYFAAQNQLLNFKFKELIFTAAKENFAVAHDLSVIPQDIIMTKITGPGKATFLHGKFNDKNMYLTVTDACRLRFFYGTYYNFQSTVNNQSTDETSYLSGG